MGQEHWDGCVDLLSVFMEHPSISPRCFRGRTFLLLFYAFSVAQPCESTDGARRYLLLGVLFIISDSGSWLTAVN